MFEKFFALFKRLNVLWILFSTIQCLTFGQAHANSSLTQIKMCNEIHWDSSNTTELFPTIYFPKNKEFMDIVKPIDQLIPDFVFTIEKSYLAESQISSNQFARLIIYDKIGSHSWTQKPENRSLMLMNNESMLPDAKLKLKAKFKEQFLPVIDGFMPISGFHTGNKTYKIEQVEPEVFKIIFGDFELNSIVEIPYQKAQYKPQEKSDSLFVNEKSETNWTQDFKDFGSELKKSWLHAVNKEEKTELINSVSKFVYKNFKYYNKFKSKPDNNIFFDHLDSQTEALKKQGYSELEALLKLKIIQCDTGAWIISKFLSELLGLKTRIGEGYEMIETAASASGKTYTVFNSGETHNFVEVWIENSWYQTDFNIQNATKAL